MTAPETVIAIEQKKFVIPDLTVKDLLGSIPAHCFKRSAIKSGSYVVGDLIGVYCTYKTTTFANSFVDTLDLPNAHVYTAAHFAIWTLYTFVAGLFGTGLWVIAHECGHQAFSESKAINNTVGWVLHSAIGVPYHSWRITHAKHHASTGHMTQDQVFVPKTRSELGLPPLDPKSEDPLGRTITEEVREELVEALGDSPIAAAIGALTYLLIGWPMYMIRNASGQRRYPVGTNHFKPTAIMFAPHQHQDIVLSDIGIALWLGGIFASIYAYGFLQTLRVYLIPYLWVNHWLVLITFLQHTDPLLPHYRAPEFTFPRGALSTVDRSLFGDLGAIPAWFGATMTHGISETHVLHHVSSKIPHYNAWEAADALRAKLVASGVELQGRPVGWAEMIRVFKECRFVEDEGDIVFYKNANGLASTRAVFRDSNVNDSGVEVDK